MDEIDITSSDFSLDVPTIPTIPIIIDNIVETITSESDEDYTIYIYIGILILILATGWVVYNYTLKKKRVTFQDKLEECYSGNDCYSGVCDRV
jgi:H+/gluconate symporter-like permease